MDSQLRGICEFAFNDKFGANVSAEHRNDRQRLERELMLKLIEKHVLAGFPRLLETVEAAPH